MFFFTPNLKKKEHTIEPHIIRNYQKALRQAQEKVQATHLTKTEKSNNQRKLDELREDVSYQTGLLRNAGTMSTAPLISQHSVGHNLTVSSMLNVFPDTGGVPPTIGNFASVKKK